MGIKVKHDVAADLTGRLGYDSGYFTGAENRRRYDQEFNEKQYQFDESNRQARLMAEYRALQDKERQEAQLNAQREQNLQNKQLQLKKLEADVADKNKARQHAKQMQGDAFAAAQKARDDKQKKEMLIRQYDEGIKKAEEESNAKKLADQARQEEEFNQKVSAWKGMSDLEKNEAMKKYSEFIREKSAVEKELPNLTEDQQLSALLGLYSKYKNGGIDVTDRDFGKIIKSDKDEYWEAPDGSKVPMPKDSKGNPDPYKAYSDFEKEKTRRMEIAAKQEEAKRKEEEAAAKELEKKNKEAEKQRQAEEARRESEMKEWQTRREKTVQEIMADEAKQGASGNIALKPYDERRKNAEAMADKLVGPNPEQKKQAIEAERQGLTNKINEHLKLIGKEPASDRTAQVNQLLQAYAEVPDVMTGDIIAEILQDAKARGDAETVKRIFAMFNELKGVTKREKEPKEIMGADLW